MLPLPNAFFDRNLPPSIPPQAGGRNYRIDNAAPSPRLRGDRGGGSVWSSDVIAQNTSASRGEVATKHSNGTKRPPGRALAALLAIACAAGLSGPPLRAEGLERVRYNNPGLVVDLAVGLWAWPLPMDYDGDGDLDLVVSCADVPHHGTYFFENPGGPGKLPVFKPGMRVGRGMSNVQVSYVQGRSRVLTPGWEYRDFAAKQFLDRIKLPVAPRSVHKGATRANQWKYADYDGDGRLDLIVGIGDWADYGWDNAYDSEGRWTRGPLHGYVYLLRNTQRGDAMRKRPKGDRIVSPEPVTYDKPVKIVAAGKPIDVFGMPTPNLADFDRDGDLDILCGEFVDKFTYFENVGTRTKPKYAAGRYLMHGGKPLAMDLCMIVPVAVDWDRDGDVDLVVGEEDGRVALVENTGRIVDGLPHFLPQQQFKQQAHELKFGALATPFSSDWDGDGDEDLICGNTAGYIGFIENLDGGNPPRWAAAKYLEADGKAIRIMAGPNGSIQGPCEAKWGYTTLSVADWDHDGLPDVVANSIWGKVVWFRNVGTRSQPKFTGPAAIEADWPGKPPKPAWTWWDPQGKQLATQWRTTPFVTDLNADGLNDLVMLDHEGYLAFFERKRVDGDLHLLPGQRIFFDAKGIEYDRRNQPIGVAAGPLRLNKNAAGRSGRRKLCMVDWDRDGRLDLLVNSRNIDLLCNVGAPGRFVFAPMGSVDALRLAGHTTSPTVVDWDRDGKPDLLVGAEDGFFYHMKTPYPVERKPAGKPSEHLVAAWDFEPGKNGPLADKATAGKVDDPLTPLGQATFAHGVGVVPRVAGSVFLANSSSDLEQKDELTIWVRLRVDEPPTSYISVVDKRHFRNPDERSYGLYIPPCLGKAKTFGIGGQVSCSGSGAATVALAKREGTVPVGQWREVAMVVRRATYYLDVRWFASKTADPARADGVQLVGGPISHLALRSIFVSKQPLFVGNDANLRAITSRLEIGEVRLYDRALTPGEFAAIVPGELSE